MQEAKLNVRAKGHEQEWVRMVAHPGPIRYSDVAWPEVLGGPAQNK